MKIRFALLWLLLLCLVPDIASARTPQVAPKQQAGGAGTPASSPGSDSARAPQIDLAKEAAIRRLIDMTGGTKAISQVMDGMEANMKPMLANTLPPGDYRDKLIDLFFEKFRSKADLSYLVNLSVQMYDKYLSKEEIEGLIQFYSTPLGQKALSVLPKLMVDMQAESMKWGENLGRESMLEVLSDHPELRKAMEDAATNSKPQ